LQTLQDSPLPCDGLSVFLVGDAVGNVANSNQSTRWTPFLSTLDGDWSTGPVATSGLQRLLPAVRDNVRSAVAKAVRRLIAKGAIEARGVYLGRNKHMTCRYVRLIGA
jgi:hypothetical protein